jgi:hypothetical protein
VTRARTSQRTGIGRRVRKTVERRSGEETGTRTESTVITELPATLESVPSTAVVTQESETGTETLTGTEITIVTGSVLVVIPDPEIIGTETEALGCPEWTEYPVTREIGRGWYLIPGIVIDHPWTLETVKGIPEVTTGLATTGISIGTGRIEAGMIEILAADLDHLGVNLRDGILLHHLQVSTAARLPHGEIIQPFLHLPHPQSAHNHTTAADCNNLPFFNRSSWETNKLLSSLLLLLVSNN